MTPRVQAEFEMLKNYVKNAECIEEPSRVVIQIHDYHLPPGWSVSAVEIAFFVPAGYPITPPDNFFVKPILRTSTGAAPVAMEMTLAGMECSDGLSSLSTCRIQSLVY